ncbi:MAG: LysM peptidoglycan-binding domain-containing protein [Acidobacteriota bacterium]|nr:LysM peptidoglycan-binding domain-containing protein [Acidobacteriota bacterium]
MSKRSIPVYERYGAAVPYEDAKLQLHAWTEGDRLSVLAEKYLDDWMKWRLIAERNNIKDARKIAIGTVLIIPQIPLEKGIYEST